MAGHPTETYVFISLILFADDQGFVDMSVEALSAVISMPVGEVSQAIDFLCQPDKRSRSSAMGGARLVPSDSIGWTIVNFDHYQYRKIDTNSPAIDTKYSNKRVEKTINSHIYNPEGVIKDTISYKDTVISGECNKEVPITTSIESGIAKNSTEIDTPFLSISKNGAGNGKRGPAAVFPDWFEELWSIWKTLKRKPAANKKATYRAVATRLKQGYKYPDIMAGTERYAAYVGSQGLQGTNSFKMASTFYGPDLHFLDDHEIPEATGSKGDRLESTYDQLRNELNPKRTLGSDEDDPARSID